MRLIAPEEFEVVAGGWDTGVYGSYGGGGYGSGYGSYYGSGYYGSYYYGSDYGSNTGTQTPQDAGIQVKAGADVDGLKPEITEKFDEIVKVFADLGLTPVITSGNDSRHGTNSLHYSDLAIDLRANNITDAQGYELRDALRKALGGDYDVLFETFTNGANDHIHIEYDPN